LIRLAGVEGLEPPTPGFGDRCSSQLSYTPRQRDYLNVFKRLSNGRVVVVGIILNANLGAILNGGTLNVRDRVCISVPGFPESPLQTPLSVALVGTAWCDAPIGLSPGHQSIRLLPIPSSVAACVGRESHR
jgi:hypothetical protein